MRINMRLADFIRDEIEQILQDWEEFAKSIFNARHMSKAGLRDHASHAVFARYLNVAPSTVVQRERGEKRPRGPSLKLLALVAKGGLRAIA